MSEFEKNKYHEKIIQEKAEFKTEKLTTEKKLDQEPAVMPNVEALGFVLENEAADISPEELEALTGVEPKEIYELMTGEEKIKIEDIKEFNSKLKKKISQEMVSQKEAYKDSGLRKIANNKFIKSAVLSLILFLKFAPQAEAAHEKKETSEAKKNKTEISIKNQNKIEGGDNTYIVGGPNPESGASLSAEKLAKLDLTNSYETDKAKISEIANEQITEQVNSFLAQINSDNYRDLMNHVWKISGSSDERLTNTWEGGNYELTEERIKTAEKILKAAINDYDYSHSGLSQEQINDLKVRPFEHDIFESKNGTEKGVKYLTDLDKNDKGEKYSQAEIDKIKETDNKKYQELLESCRYIKVNLMAEADKLPHLNNKPAEVEKNHFDLKKVDNKLIDFEGYKAVMLLYDKSGSMQASKNSMAQYLTDNYQAGLKVTTASFSNLLDDYKSDQDMRVASKSLKEMSSIGSSNERAIKCAIEAMRLFEAQEHEGDGLALVGTDESLQQVSYNDLLDLQQLGQEKKVDIKFLITHLGEAGKLTEKVGLDDVIKSFLSNDASFAVTKARLEGYANTRGLSAGAKAVFEKQLEKINDSKFNINKLLVNNEAGEEEVIQLALY